MTLGVVLLLFHGLANKADFRLPHHLQRGRLCSRTAGSGHHGHAISYGRSSGDKLDLDTICLKRMNSWERRILIFEGINIGMIQGTEEARVISWLWFVRLARYAIFNEWHSSPRHYLSQTCDF